MNEYQYEIKKNDSATQQNWLILGGLFLVLGFVHILVFKDSEPFYNNDEIRHVMTGVFFHDLFSDFSNILNLKEYTINYYFQYPALGILVWPPFFYLLEGLVMLLFGISIIVSKSLMFVLLIIACLFFYLIVCKTHNDITAIIATSIFAFTPVIFEFSRQVMLEIPTLAFALGAIYFFLVYLDKSSVRAIYFAALFFSFAVLTRYSAIFLIPLFAILLFERKMLSFIRKRDFLLSIALIAVLVVPTYVLNISMFAENQLNAASSTFSKTSEMSILQIVFSYPSLLPQQLGWVQLLTAIVGIFYSLRLRNRRKSLLYFAMVLSVYLLFTPLSTQNPHSRYVIYWIPAFSLFAAEGIIVISNWTKKKYQHLFALIVIVCTAATALSQTRPYLRGYEQAAQYVVSNTEKRSLYLIDGEFDGNFIYQIRRLDPNRKLWVLRSEKLFYNFVVYSHINYQELVNSEEDILAIIFKFDPEFLIVEEPRLLDSIPMADTLRAVIERHPERFRLEKTVPIETNDKHFNNTKLKIFRNIYRNNHPENNLQFELPGLKKTFKATITPNNS